MMIRQVITVEFDQIIESYLQTNSTKKTARELKISEVKVRRVLITCGLWQSPTSEQIEDLHKKGLSVKEIAQQLYMSEKNVQAYLPYARGTYGGPDKTAEAVRSAAYRERLKNALSHQVIQIQSSEPRKEENHSDTERGTHMNEPVNIIRLHLDLDLNRPSERDWHILRKYGKMEDGLTREILVPDTMTLHALHYVIQKVYGWQNSHLHHFSLPDDIFQLCTKNSFERWTKLCGVYFRFPSDDMEDLYWDDDYDGRISFNSWLRRKYTGPYTYGGNSENYLETQLEVRDFYRHFKLLEIHRPWREMDKDRSNMIEKVIDPRDATIEEVFCSIMFDSPANTMLERLTLRELLCDYSQIPKDIDPNSVAVRQITDRLVYEYDYGDGWTVYISLMDEGSPTQEQIEKIQAMKPVCTARDGINVLDDVGGITGFCDFLQTLHEGEPEEREQMRKWSKIFDWTGRMTKPERIL